MSEILQTARRCRTSHGIRILVFCVCLVSDSLLSTVTLLFLLSLMDVRWCEILFRTTKRTLLWHRRVIKVPVQPQ